MQIITEFSLSYILNAVLQRALSYSILIWFPAYMELSFALLQYSCATVLLYDFSSKFTHSPCACTPLAPLSWTNHSVQSDMSQSVETVQNIVNHHLQRLLCWRGWQALQRIQRLQE